MGRRDHTAIAALMHRGHMRDGWVAGDIQGIEIPAHAAALREGGARYLTRAFHAAGSLAVDNRVTAIRRAEAFDGGSTGSKLLLEVEYDRDCKSLHKQLFVKFSRDFNDAARDNARLQMRREVRFVLLSRALGFPIRVPACYCADWEESSGTGMLITEFIAYGASGIAPHYAKCRDYDLEDPVAHYRAIVRSLGRLAAYDRAGNLAPVTARDFAFEPEQLTV
ncbi:MAG: hypothetical protein HKN19_00900, partial [Halioglobus sp.]|nr:hypothetical protein [Halioglobus sp.]